jgi:hypothetical protein
MTRPGYKTRSLRFLSVMHVLRLPGQVSDDTDVQREGESVGKAKEASGAVVGFSDDPGPRPTLTGNRQLHETMCWTKIPSSFTRVCVPLLPVHWKAQWRAGLFFFFFGNLDILWRQVVPYDTWMKFSRVPVFVTLRESHWVVHEITRCDPVVSWLVLSLISPASPANFSWKQSSLSRGFSALRPVGAG